MSGVNKVLLIGNLGADPEVKYTQGGQAVCELRIATNEAWTDKNGQKQEKTEWHRVVVWGKRAEVCGKYLSKGKQVYIDGKLRTRAWEDKDGNKRYTTEIVAHDVQFLGGRDGGGNGGGQRQERTQGGGDYGYGYGDYEAGPAPSGGDDDIPF